MDKGGRMNTIEKKVEAAMRATLIFYQNYAIANGEYGAWSYSYPDM